MTISAQQIRDALIGEHAAYIDECGVEPGELSLDDYIAFVNTLSYDELVTETSTDDSYPLSDFIYAYS